jgi:hypothetical protein
MIPYIILFIVLLVVVYAAFILSLSQHSKVIKAEAEWMKRKAELDEKFYSRAAPMIMFNECGLLTVDYVMRKHPELNEEQAKSLVQFSVKHTIRMKECYGDGSIMYPLWKESLKEANT